MPFVLFYIFHFELFIKTVKLNFVISKDSNIELFLPSKSQDRICLLTS